VLPISKTITGTGTLFLVHPDIMQDPFSVNIGVQLLTGGLATAIVSIEHSFDYSTVMAPNFNGLTATIGGSVSTAIWFTNAGLNTQTVTATVGTGSFTAMCSYSSPVAAIRLNVISATATSFVAVNLIQASKAP
jgi:hypothetical protein